MLTLLENQRDIETFFMGWCQRNNPWMSTLFDKRYVDFPKGTMLMTNVKDYFDDKYQRPLMR